jgi:hypothetical protein
MLVKFFATGTGCGEAPVNYLCKDRDPKPEVVSGNPDRTVTIINHLPFKYKYTSGVLSFAPEDCPSEAKQKELISDFERFAFAGIEKNEYDILWVKHQHCNRIELHFVTPRCHLKSGKSYNVAPPGWEDSYNLWQQQWINAEGWANPADQRRARACSPGKSKHCFDIKNEITDKLIEQIYSGQIKSEPNLINSLHDQGYSVSRRTTSGLIISDRQLGKTYRLEGTLYKKGADFPRVAELSRVKPVIQNTSDIASARKWQRLAEADLYERSQFNASKYGSNAFSSPPRRLTPKPCIKAQSSPITVKKQAVDRSFTKISVEL